MSEGLENGVIEPAAPPKVDPETLVLRAKPARVIRFRRGVVVALAALASVSVVATAWVALRPTAFRIVGRNDDRSDTGRAPTDTLSGLPSSYGDAPKLGPPLPGDLGRPILDQQRSLAPAADPPINDGQGADPAAVAEREARAADLKAARQSGVLVKSTSAELSAERPGAIADRRRSAGRGCRQSRARP